MAPPKCVCGTDRTQLATAGAPQSVAERTGQRTASYQDRLQLGHLLEALHTDGVDGHCRLELTETDMARQLGVLPLRVRQIMARLQGGAQAAAPLYSNKRQMPAQSTSLQRAAKEIDTRNTVMGCVARAQQWQSAWRRETPRRS